MSGQAVNPLQAAIALICAGMASHMPEKLGLAGIELSEVKVGGSEKTSNYRLGIIPDDDISSKLFLTVPVISADKLAQDKGYIVPDEKKGTYVLDPLILDAKDQPVWSANLWFEREAKKGGKAGTMMLHQLPIHSVRKTLGELAASLKNPDLLKYMEENNLLSHSNPVELNGETRTLTILAVPLSFLPKELRLLSVYGTVDPKTGIVTFKAADRYGNWCMGWNPNRINAIDPQTKQMRTQVRSGEIPTLGGQSGAPRPANIVKLLQNTIDEAVKTLLAEKKIEKLVVEVVPSRRETQMSARDKLLAASIGASAPAPAPTPENKVPDAPADNPATEDSDKDKVEDLFTA